MISNNGLNKYAVIITGACGFIGKELVQVLLREGCAVVAIDVKESFPEEVENSLLTNFLYLPKDFRRIDNEINHYLKRKSALSAVLIHLASVSDVSICQQYPQKAYDLNIHLTSHVLEYCRNNKISKIIFPSTGLVYSDCLNYPLKEENNIFPDSIYVCLNKIDLYQGDKAAKLDEIKKQIEDFFGKRKIKINDIFITCGETIEGFEDIETYNNVVAEMILKISTSH